MEYHKIVSVTGLPGLYELLSSKSDGAILRSLDDKSTRFVSSRVHNFSHLESIEVYTMGENVNLVEIFNAMEKSDTKVPDEKDAGGIRKYFESIYADIDFEKVYNSDMKKMVKWFKILKNNGIEIKLSEPELEETVEEPEVEQPVIEETPEPAPKPKVPRKTQKEEPVKAEKSTPKKATKADKEEKPAKKEKKETSTASAKKEKEKAPAKKAASKSTKKK